MLKMKEYVPLNLRHALNKIAHANPQTADYYVSVMGIPPFQVMAHDLLLYGDHRRKQWFAAISLLELVKQIRALPDATLQDLA